MAGWDDGIGVKVRGWLLGMCWQTDLTSAQPELFLWATMPAATFCCGASIPTAMSMASMLHSWAFGPHFSFLFLTDMYLYDHMTPTHMTAYLYNRSHLVGNFIVPSFCTFPIVLFLW